jgi:hypothetical protein
MAFHIGFDQGLARRFLAWLRRDRSSARRWALFPRYLTWFTGGEFRFISRLTEEGLLSRDSAMEWRERPCSSAMAISGHVLDLLS